MLDAIDGIAKKVVDGRTIALGCSCPLDGGACHRNILRRAILQAAERKQREIDLRLYDRLRGRRHRSRSRSPPLPFGGGRSHSSQRFGGRSSPEQHRFG